MLNNHHHPHDVALTSSGVVGHFQPTISFRKLIREVFNNVFAAVTE